MKFYRLHKKKLYLASFLLFIVLLILPFATTKKIKIDEPYESKEEVALYLITYHELPKNYITKSGLDYAISHFLDVSDKCVGGDTHHGSGNIMNYVPQDSTLKEADIKGDTYNISKKQRGLIRIVYTCNTKNVRVFYTEDHYNTYVELTPFLLQKTRNICLIILGSYTLIIIIFFSVMEIKQKKEAIRSTASS